MVNTWDASAFASLLDEIRERTGLSQAAMARLAGFDQSRITRWKSGQNRPDYDSIVSLVTGVTGTHPGVMDMAPRLFTAAGYGPELPPDLRPGFVRDHWEDQNVQAIWGLGAMPRETRAGLIAHYLRGAPDLSGNGGDENGTERQA
jgi:transcriptional regulator with XRE-family HTH domain